VYHKINSRGLVAIGEIGLIINPDGLRRCIEGNVIHGTSRALSEEIAFDRAKVTSTDWLSYPIAAWRQAAKGLPRTPPLSDEAISRESIYCDRG
jgi:hypothetical protein